MHVTCGIQEKSQAFRFIQTPYLDKMTFFLVNWSLTVEINIRYNRLIIGYFVFENNLSNVCASATLLSKTDTVVLTLWASMCTQLFEAIVKST